MPMIGVPADAAFVVFAYETLVVVDAVTRTLVALYPAAPPVNPDTVITVPTGMAVVIAENVNVATDPVPDAPVMLIVVAVLLGEM